jgi:hypothetical protein
MQARRLYGRYAMSYGTKKNLFNSTSRRGRVQKWEKEYEQCVGVLPNRWAPVRGAKADFMERVRVIHGNPQLPHKVVTVLHTEAQADFTSGTNTSCNRTFDLANPNDPTGAVEKKHPMYHDIWITHGMDLAMPLIMRFHLRIRPKAGETVKDAASVWYVFWRVVPQNMGGEAAQQADTTTADGAKDRIRNYIANRHWSWQRITTLHDDPSIADFCDIKVAVPIQSFITAVDSDLTAMDTRVCTFSDSQTSITNQARPYLQVIMVKEDGSAFTATEALCEISTSMTVLLEDSDFSNTAREHVMDEHA